MSGYTKVFESIIHSTIWGEPDHIRIVWVTMLAMKDEDGVVEASIPGLMNASRKARKDVESALERLSAPDPDSRNPENEGRRIAKVPGGWLVLNHEYYKNKMTEAGKTERRRELGRVRQQNFRDRRNAEVTQSNANQIRSDQIRVDKKRGDAPARDQKDFDEFWSAYPKKAAKKDAVKAWKQTESTRPPLPDLLAALRRHSQGRQWQDGVYPHAATWLRGERWNDEPERERGAFHSAPRHRYIPTEPEKPMTDEEKAENARIVAGITGSGGVEAIEARQAERAEQEKKRRGGGNA